MNPKDVPVAKSGITAPTPQNTPLTSAPIAHGLSRPTVPDISEDIEEDDGDDDDDDDDDEEGGVGGGGTAGAVQQAMLKLVHGRLAHLVGKSSGYIESLPVEVKRTVEALKGVQSDYEKIQMEYKKEMYLLEMKVLSCL
jgi:nucleosome assembly protein 1-like 1